MIVYGPRAAPGARFNRPLRANDRANGVPQRFLTCAWLGWILPSGYNWSVTKSELGLILTDARRRAGKTQAELAEAMGTTQPAIARAEGGYRMPTIGFIERWAGATGSPISLRLGQAKPKKKSAADRRAMVRSALGPGRFNPWDRKLDPIEAAILDQAGLNRKYFEQLRRPRGQRRRTRPAAG